MNHELESPCVYAGEYVNPSESKQQSALNTYTNVWRSESQKKKVPEPSALLGLVALPYLVQSVRQQKYP